MYSVDAYGKMITDEPRTQAYIQALQKTVKPGSVVVEIGTGPGFFAMLAAKLGARRVYAIEPDNVIQIARESARQNGLRDKIEFIQDFSTKICLPEPADVILADLRGVLPFYGASLRSMQDATKRFLRAGGTVIPARDFMQAALASAPTTYKKLEGPWHTLEDISLKPARNVVMNTWSKYRGDAAELLCEPLTWHTINYSNIESLDAASDLTFETTQSGTLHGIAVWFDSDLYDGVSISNAPGQPELVYGNAFFPLLHPVDVEIGEKVHLRLRVDLVRDEYIWSWETRVPRANSDEPKAHFKQSTLFGVPLAQSQLKKRSSSFRPALSDEAEVSAFVLSQMDGISSNQEIAQKVLDKFPERFATDAEALDAVAETAVKHSR
jgi:type I protein arginine methyltransferase